MDPKAPLDVLLIGAGNRGTFAYGPYATAHPNEIRFTAVAEPDPVRRARFADLHSIPQERQFSSWKDVVGLPKLAHAALNTTMDQEHFESAVSLMRAGYELLLEKPMAMTAEDCRELIRVSEETGRTLQICHVLRFTDFFSKLYDIVNSGRLGRIVTVDHRENVSYLHMSHSYVRGNWGNTSRSGPMILAKSCHDMDILSWIIKQPIKSLSSFGSLMHYRSEHAPTGAPTRCTDGCPAQDQCLWYAPKLYGAINGAPSVSRAMEKAFGPDSMSPQERWARLTTSPYGACVYRTDNDVVDHQVVNMEFEDGLTCTFTMHGHSEREGRTMRWDGTKATLIGDFSTGRPLEFRIYDHGNEDSPEIIRCSEGSGGHGGGDNGLMNNFVRTLRGEKTPHSTTARVSLQSHLMCFAAEEARKNNKIVTFV